MDNIAKEYYNKVKPLVTKIRNYKCPNCNGNYTNCECDFCGEKNEELEESLNSLEEILNNFKLNTKDKDITTKKCAIWGPPCLFAPTVSLSYSPLYSSSAHFQIA